MWLRQAPNVSYYYYHPMNLHVIIDPVSGTAICDGARPFRLDFTGQWRIWEVWPWFGPRGGIGGGQVVIYLYADGAAFYRFYHGPIDLPGGRPDVTIAAACYNPSEYFGAPQNNPLDPMKAQVTFR